MKKRVAFHNLGCKVNAYETGAMLQSLLAEGYEEAPFEPGADVYVINTCTVTNIADRKSRQMLHKAREMNPDALVVAVGCYVEDGARALQEEGTVDLLVGNNEKSRLAELIRDFQAVKDAGEGDPLSRRRENINHVRNYEELHFLPEGERTRAYVKIQDGCNQFCTYCMIPYVRGRVRSRDAGEVVRETRALAERGYREIVVTGIHISSYGLDLVAPGENRMTPFAHEAETNEALASLIEAMAAVPGIDRIRLGSLEPGIMTEDFVRRLSAIREICPQFHLSLQSGCDETLARMRRRYRTADFADKCRLLRKYFANPAITTDIIVGFPGETEEEFETTCRFVEGIHFSRTHIFKYSKRKGTKAASMPNQVSEQVKKERSARLLDLDARRRAEYAASWVGQPVEVLFEEPTPDGAMKGYTREYVEVRSKDSRADRNAVVTGRGRAVTGEILEL